MAIAANSYGSTDGVAALTPRYANAAKVFDGGTNPTLGNVEKFIDQVSSLLNIMLAREGFVIPVSNADAVLMLSMFVTEEVAQIVEGINGSGRFGPGAKQVGRSRYQLITADVQDFIATNKAGIEAIGATQAAGKSDMGAVGYRDTDESGRATSPIFQRSGFGNTFQDWDSG